MSTNSSVANLSITVVKTLVKMAGFGRVADMIDGGQEFLNLLADIKSDALDSPNAEMIRSLNGAVKSELDAIQDALKHNGLGGKQVKQATAQLAEAARETIKDLAEDDNALTRAVQQPRCFAEQLRGHAAPLPDYSSDEMQDHYETLLDRIAEEFLTLAPWSPRFQPVALTRLLHCFPDLANQIARFEQGANARFDKVDDDHQTIIDLLKGKSSPAVSPVIFGSRPDAVAGDRFVDRGVHGQLKALISDPTRQRTVLVGMRGCGKTQLAAALAQECEDANWSLVAWVHAGSPESIKSGLVELAKQFKIDTSDQPTQDVIIRRCLGHLKSTPAADRLIVFDNVEDINHLTGLIPSGNGLRVIATTTNDTGWEHQDWTTMKVGMFDRSESINFLLTVMKSDDHDSADALAERLGDLPLAIAQAAATARNSDRSLTRYLERLDAYGSERVIHPVPGDYYTDDVATALSMAIEDALENLEDGAKQAARYLLGTLALLAESGVPTRWLDPTIEQQDDRGLQDANRAEDEDAHDALTELIHRSIVQQSADKATTMLHRLQAHAFRESWNANEAAEAYRSAVILLGRVNIDIIPRNNTYFRRQETLALIEQLRAIGDQTYSQQLLASTQIRFMLNHALTQAYDLDLSHDGITLSSTVLLAAERFASNTEDQLTLLNSLAVVWHFAGYLDVAINMYEENLKKSIDFHGAEHFETLYMHSNLLYAYRTAGRLDEAITQSEQLIKHGTKVLGADHALILTVRNNLASCYELCGQLDRAINLYEQVLDDLVRVQGSHDPKTLATRNNLAGAYESTGRLDEAITLYEQVLPDRIRVLGKDHPDTLTSRNNLAGAYESTGRLTEAITLYEQVLPDRIRVLGKDHPDTLTSRNNLAGAYRAVGRLEEAITLYEQVLTDRIRILSKDHPNTLTSRNNLAGAYRAVGRLEEAITLYEQVTKDCARILGEDHPLTKTVRKNLEAAQQELAQGKDESPTEESAQED